MDDTQPLVTDALPAPADTSVTAPDATAASDSAAQEQPAKSFSQEEVDALIAKRLAKEQRKWERKIQQPATPPAPAAREVPPADQFESVEAYAQALAEKRAAELVQQREVQQQQAQVLASHGEREEAARDRYDDYEDVVYNPRLPITPIMAQTIQASDSGPDVAYYLGSNPKEAERIARLPAILQAKEIGKLEAKVAAAPPAKRTTTAPAPINPVNARASGNPSYDTTDPRSVKTMSTSEWIEADRARQIRKLQAQMQHR